MRVELRACCSVSGSKGAPAHDECCSGPSDGGHLPRHLGSKVHAEHVVEALGWVHYVPKEMCVWAGDRVVELPSDVSKE